MGLLPMLFMTARFRNIGKLFTQPCFLRAVVKYLNAPYVLSKTKKHSLLFSQLIQADELSAWVLSFTFLVHVFAASSGPAQCCDLLVQAVSQYLLSRRSWHTLWVAYHLRHSWGGAKARPLGKPRWAASLKHSVIILKFHKKISFYKI